MTHPTDEELDALVNRAGDAPLDDKDNCFICYEAVVAITTLRAQLAAASARADLAEAALAALIEYGPVRTGLADKDGREICVGDRLRHLNSSPSTKKEYWFPEYEVIWDAPSFRLKPTGGGKPSDNGFAFKYYSREFETIRNQPHDRSALDRLLADAEAKASANALRRVVELPHRIESLGGQNYAYVRVEEILALIPKEGKQ